MVLLEHVGFGGRERDVWLYWWDERDGPDWSGWWMGLDYCGNSEFILHCAADVADPSLATVGEWRSDFVENTQLKRPLHVGFRAESGGFSVCGTDSCTPIVPCAASPHTSPRSRARASPRLRPWNAALSTTLPLLGSDKITKIVLSEFLFTPDGANHGRPAYRAQPRPPPSKQEGQEGWRARLASPIVYVTLGVVLGVSAAVALGTVRSRAR